MTSVYFVNRLFCLIHAIWEFYGDHEISTVIQVAKFTVPEVILLGTVTLVFSEDGFSHPIIFPEYISPLAVKKKSVDPGRSAVIWCTKPKTKSLILQ